MVSLVDIVPQTRTVELAGGEIELRGLGLRQIADLMMRFPGLQSMILLALEGRMPFDPDTFLLAAPEAVGAVIAEAARQPEAADAVADALSLDDAVECLIVVFDLTMPGGAVPFFHRIERLLGRLRGDDAQPGKAPDTSLPRPPNGSLPPDTIPAP
jgi:hypothetical protein